MTKISMSGYMKHSKDKNEPDLIIPNNEITMRGVDHPVFGMSDTGDAKMMYPGLDYSFGGNYVYEIPMSQMKQGGYILPGRYRNPEGNWLNKYQKGGTRQKIYNDPIEFARANRAYNDSLEVYNSPKTSYDRETEIRDAVSNNNFQKANDLLAKPFPSYDAFRRLIKLNKIPPKPLSGYPIYLGSNPSNPLVAKFKKPTQQPVYKEKPVEYVSKAVPIKKEPIELVVPQSDRTLMPYNNTLQVLHSIQYEDRDKHGPKVVPAPEFRSGGWLDKYQDGKQVKTYASDPSYFDNRAVFVDNPQANDLVRSKVYAGTHGWDPSSNSLVKLDKPIAVSKAVQEMSTADWGKKSSKERFESNTPAGKATRKAVAAREMEQAVTNPYFRGAIPAMLAAPLIAGAAPAISGALSAPLTIGSTAIPGATMGNALGAGFAADAIVNRLPEIPGQLSRGEYTNAAVNAATGALDIYGANMVSPLAKGVKSALSYNPSSVNSRIFNENYGPLFKFHDKYGYVPDYTVGKSPRNFEFVNPSIHRNIHPTDLEAADNLGYVVTPHEQKLGIDAALTNLNAINLKKAYGPGVAEPLPGKARGVDGYYPFFMEDTKLFDTGNNPRPLLRFNPEKAPWVNTNESFLGAENLSFQPRTHTKYRIAVPDKTTRQRSNYDLLNWDSELKTYVPKELPGSSNVETELDAIRGLLKTGNEREVSKVLTKKTLPVTASEHPFSKTYPTLSKHDELVRDSYIGGASPNEPAFWRWYNKKEHGLDHDRPIPVFNDPSMPTDFMSTAAAKGNMVGENQVLTQQSRLLNPDVKAKFFEHQAPAVEGRSSILQKMPKDYGNRITPENYEDFVKTVHGSTDYDLAKSTGKLPSNLGIGSYGKPGMVYSDAPLNNLGKDIINAHEKNHGIFAGTLSKEMSADLLKPFGTNKVIPHYADKHQADEVLARMGQFKNAAGIGDNQVFTLGHLNLIRKNYANHFLDNGITEMLSKLKPGSSQERQFLKNMNKYAFGIAAPTTIGVAALQKEKDGGWLERYQTKGQVTPPANLPWINHKGQVTPFLQNAPQSKSIETKVSEFLGNPQQKAHDLASWAAEDPGEEIDNIRHPAAAMYTTNELGSSLGAAALANALGAAHEISSFPSMVKSDGVYDALRSSAEDIFNNAVGAGVGMVPSWLLPEPAKESLLIYLSDNNMLPDGISSPKGDMYVNRKKEGGPTPAMGYYDYLKGKGSNAYSGIFANGGVSSKKSSWLNKYK